MVNNVEKMLADLDPRKKQGGSPKKPSIESMIKDLESQVRASTMDAEEAPSTSKETTNEGIEKRLAELRSEIGAVSEEKLKREIRKEDTISPEEIEVRKKELMAQLEKMKQEFEGARRIEIKAWHERDEANNKMDSWKQTTAEWKISDFDKMSPTIREEFVRLEANRQNNITRAYDAQSRRIDLARQIEKLERQLE